ncbi:MAG: hypothetical protein U9N30_09365, partial [Campylobacterota bacterium]|nr:hypothetical protein [Campylobacterota bacterium]
GESGWGMQVGATVFDLNSPRMYGSDNDFSQCDWRNSTGIMDHKKYREPKPYNNNKYTNYGFANNKKVHGLIDGKSGKNPRGYIQFGGGVGLLSSIDCEIDRKGKDDNMKCQELKLKDVRLALVSKQDIKANSWRSPGRAQIPQPLTQFSQGKMVNVKSYKAKVSRSKTAIAKAKRHSTLIKAVKQPRYKVPAAQIKIINKRLKMVPLKITPTKVIKSAPKPMLVQPISR